MMRKVKYALAFLAGAGYASSWWCAITIRDIYQEYLFVPLLITTFGSVGLFLAVATSLIKHWEED